MRSLREEIARSHQTPDTDPIQYDDHKNVNVEFHANDAGGWSVEVECISDPQLSSGLKRFPDEPSATHFARQQVDRIVRATMNENLRILIRSLILEMIEQ